MWSRRDLLRAAGVGVAASIVGDLGCRTPTPPAAPVREVDPALRPALRDALAVLATRLTEPVVFARLRRRIRAAVDLLERDVADDTVALVVLAGRGADGQWREHAIDRVEPALVQAAARTLIATAPAGPGAAVVPGPIADLAPPVDRDPATLALTDWRDRLDELATRAASGGNSRVVYRAVYAITDDETRWVVSAAGDHRERRVRSRIGAVAVAWHGSAPIAGAVEVAGAFGPDTARLTTAALTAINQEALALTTPGAFAAQPDATVVLAPAVAATLIARVGAVADGPVAIVDDPGELADGAGYGSFAVDDLGRPTAGQRAGWLRRDRDGRTVAAFANLVVAPGTVADLTAATGAEAFLVDGVADVGGRGDQLALRATRVRRLERGRLTGHAWRDVELRGSARGLLAATTAVGVATVTVAHGDDDVPQAIVTPGLVTRAALVPSRGAA
ncbi:MAG: hypothetical protein JNK64_40935 [Myxococcales bacterium]|nr:hypothetical protein [Myxococcales bacterium]